MSLALGNIYTAAEQHSAAERWYRRLVKLAPQQYAPLAASLGRQNRLGEAVTLCVEAGKTDHSARPAIVLASVLGASKTAVDEEVFRRAEPLLSPSPGKPPQGRGFVERRCGRARVAATDRRGDRLVPPRSSRSSLKTFRL